MATKEITNSFARDDDEVLATTNPKYAQGRLVEGASAENVIVFDTDPDTTVLADQQQISVELDHDANTLGNPTGQLGSTASKEIVRGQNLPLQIGDTGGIGYSVDLKFSAALDKWVLLNPVNPTRRGALFVDGLVISNNSGDAAHDIDVSSGKIMASTGQLALELLTTITKQIDNTFAVGTNLGGFSDQSTLSNSTWYRIFLIEKVDGTSDVIFAADESDALNDTVVAAANFIYARRIGWFFSDSSSNIEAWVDGGFRKYAFDDQATLSFSASITEVIVTAQVPPNQLGDLIYSLRTSSATGTQGLINQTNQPNNTVNDGNHSISVEGDGTDFGHNTIGVLLKVDSSSQVRRRESSAVGFGFLKL